MKIKDLTERIGPHETREAAMLLAGTKPAAIIHRREDMERLAPAIRTGKLVKMPAPLIGWLVAQKKYEGYLKDMYYRLNKIKHMEEMDMEDYHRSMGKMLGYEQSDVDFFINRLREKGKL